MQTGVFQHPDHAHERQQIGDRDDRPSSEFVGALNRPQFSGLSAQGNPIITPDAKSEIIECLITKKEGGTVMSECSTTSLRKLPIAGLSLKL
jgi:hypothetical protein